MTIYCCHGLHFQNQVSIVVPNKAQHNPFFALKTSQQGPLDTMYVITPSI